MEGKEKGKGKGKEERQTEGKEIGVEEMGGV